MWVARLTGGHLRIVIANPGRGHRDTRNTGEVHQVDKANLKANNKRQINAKSKTRTGQRARQRALKRAPVAVPTTSRAPDSCGASASALTVGIGCKSGRKVVTGGEGGAEQRGNITNKGGETDAVAKQVDSAASQTEALLNELASDLERSAKRRCKPARADTEGNKTPKITASHVPSFLDHTISLE